MPYQGSYVRPRRTTASTTAPRASPFGNLGKFASCLPTPCLPAITNPLRSFQPLKPQPTSRYPRNPMADSTFEALISPYNTKPFTTILQLQVDLEWASTLDDFDDIPEDHDYAVVDKVDEWEDEEPEWEDCYPGALNPAEYVPPEERADPMLGAKKTWGGMVGGIAKGWFGY
ncbi:hypothetical protein BJ508DRAFT_328187 [Ascobolus immersus RN42]|uniref:Uncharacterized protein n=1 Tax=Ascobolus immersus RN42 TaxID=1160509 RepID=A0A3N4I0H7_ASCIM|nr:hypothetical protein BJ508DRAFT_328187 [Ascobolus immersus RN42]